MPAIRLIDKAFYSYNPVDNPVRAPKGRVARNRFTVKSQHTVIPSRGEVATRDLIYYPTSVDERKAFRANSGKSLTTHQWDVYDFVYTIPHGKVTTYKDVSAAVGGSPRSVGNALRNNPFAPYIPCHRVIASNHFIGGFFGEWGRAHKTGTRCDQKLQLLRTEGVDFNADGYLVDINIIWNGSTIL